MTKLYTTEDIERLRVIHMYLSGQYSRKMAATNLNVTERQITRITQKYLQDGPESVFHGNTGRAAYNKYPDELREQIVSLYKNKYGENGVKLNFCHFKDKLEDEGIHVSYSTLSRILKEEGISPPEARVPKVISSPRPRRIYAGELVQIDASIHRWLYDDYHSYALHGAIDDATDKITGLWLEKSENTHGYQMILYQTMKRYGLPKCFYGDNRNIFCGPKNRKSKTSKTKTSLNSSRFRALLTRLGIDIITTSNPRAKGRIERIWRTLQSRLLNELYLHRITTLEEANTFIQEYLPVLNKAFASEINPNRNAFKSIPANYDYNQNLALRKEVSVYGGRYFVMSGHYYLIKRQDDSTKNEGIYPIPGKAWLYHFLDGSYHVNSAGEWYEIEDIGPKSAHQQLVDIQRTIAAKKNLNSPWRQFNPNYLNRDRAKWDDENMWMLKFK